MESEKTAQSLQNENQIIDTTNAEYYAFAHDIEQLTGQSLQNKNQIIDTTNAEYYAFTHDIRQLTGPSLQNKNQIIDTTNAEYYAFAHDIQQFIALISKNFHANKEIFFKELICNASDALHKLRYNSITDPNGWKLDLEPNFRIRIVPDKENNTLTIYDTGIGMNKKDIISYLGTTKQGGIRQLLGLREYADISDIVRFGIGFYSAFLVADKVQVISHSVSDGQYIWESTTGSSIFSVTEDSHGETISRGTKVILFLKPDSLEFLESARIRELVMKYFEFISYPIELKTEMKTGEDVADDDSESESKEIQEEEEGVFEIREENESRENKEKKAKGSVIEFEKLGKVKPIWARKPEEITKQEYFAYYKSISNDYEEPLAFKHFFFDGYIEFKCILFVPRRASFDPFETMKKNNISLYIRKVFIMDDCEYLIPEFLGFMKGVVDSEDLPLNISRETLSDNKILKVMKKNIVKKCLEFFSEIAENQEEFKKFYEQFSKNLKLGVQKDSINRNKIADLLRFYTSRSEHRAISLKEYVSKMQPEQKEIFFIIDESKQSAGSSPFIEPFKKRGYEVLYMIDDVDNEYVIQQLKEYDGKLLRNCKDLDLDIIESEKKKSEEQKADYEEVCKIIKEVLGDKVMKVQVGETISDSPCVLVSGSGWSAGLERIMKAQAMRDSSMDPRIVSMKALEINPNHPIIAELKRINDKEESDKTLQHLVWSLFNEVLLSSDFSLNETNK